jgi:hypothetical protein
MHIKFKKTFDMHTSCSPPYHLEDCVCKKKLLSIVYKVKRIFGTPYATLTLLTYLIILTLLCCETGLLRVHDMFTVQFFLQLNAWQQNKQKHGTFLFYRKNGKILFHRQVKDLVRQFTSLPKGIRLDMFWRQKSGVEQTSELSLYVYTWSNKVVNHSDYEN